MESSSENSFAWTDTSRDSSVDSNQMHVSKEKIDENIVESSNSLKKKMIKLEQESDIDLHRKKKKIKLALQDMSYDETYLNIAVKEEVTSALSSTKQKKKKKIRHSSLESTTAVKFDSREIDKYNSSSERNDGNVASKHVNDHENDSSKSKKKNKRSKNKYDSDEHNPEIEDKHIGVYHNQNASQDMSYDESYLSIKVKEEVSSASSSTKQKKKKKKRHSSLESRTAEFDSKENDKYNSPTKSNDGNVTLKQESDHETDSNKSKKNKKKYDCDGYNLEIEDKIDIEETVVTKPEKTNKIRGKFDQTLGSVNENDTFQEKSEESGDEISAIKFDNEHNIHTIRENNKSLCNYTLSEHVSSQHCMSKKSTPDHNLNENSVKTPRLSDRIQFEDEYDTNINSSQFNENDHPNNKRSSKTKQFVKKNLNLKLLPQNFHSNLSLTHNDEIWILKCPTEIDINAFNSTSLNIHAKCKIKVGGITYDGSAEEEQSDTVTLLTTKQNFYEIRNLPLSGILNLRKRIPKAHFRDDNVMVNNQTNFIPLPETKCRHPLFGANYKKALKVPSAIAKRLNVQDNEESTVKTGKKKNKKKKYIFEQSDTQIPNVLKIESEPDAAVKAKEKRKKRKIADDEGPIPKKVKRIKHDPESAAAWESETAIEQNLFNF